MTTSVHVATPGRPYDVLVGQDLIPEVGRLAAAAAPSARRALVVTQPTVERNHAEGAAAGLRAAGLDTHLTRVPDGDAAKTLDTLRSLYDRAAAVPLGRSDLVVAVGGGAVVDLAGFFAATWHRGVDVVHVPTTLLAQVDAAIGGKTGLNLRAGKNLVGAFHQPLLVVADTTTLDTLPPRDLVAGLAEVVKCGLIRDPSVLELLEADPRAAAAGAPELTEELVLRAATVKAGIVASDERERGERAHLNLGHTFGHALEAVTGYRRYRHGEAVSVGTCVALRLGRSLDLTPAALVPRTEALLRDLGLPVTAAPVDRRALWAAMTRDKKAGAGDGDHPVRFVLLEDLARPVLAAPPPAAIDAAIDQVEAT